MNALQRFRIRDALLVIVLATAGNLSGCTWMNDNPMVANATITYGTQKYIERADDWVDKASSVIEFAERAKTLTADNQSGISQIHSLVMGALPSDLGPADRTAAALLINALAAEVDRRMSAGVLDSGTIVTVHEVLDTVIVAASIYLVERA